MPWAFSTEASEALREAERPAGLALLLPVSHSRCLGTAFEFWSQLEVFRAM